MEYSDEQVYGYVAALVDLDDRIKGMSEEEREADLDALAERFGSVYAIFESYAGAYGMAREHRKPGEAIDDGIRRDFQNCCVDLMVVLTLLYSDANGYMDKEKGG